MALFRRRRSTTNDSAVAVDEFWSQWADLRDELAASVDAKTAVPDEVAQRLTERVRRLHENLTWDVCPAPRPAPQGLDELAASFDDEARTLLSGDEDASQTAEEPAYALILSAGADENARVVAEQWRRAAPNEPQWRFFGARPADHEQLTTSLTWHDHELDLAHATVALRVDQKAGTIEASVYHPDFMFLDEETQVGVAKKVALLALGEDDYIRWIGSVTPLTEKPLDPLPPTSMPAVVRQLADALGGGWVTLQGRIPLRGTTQILVRHPLHRRDFPAFTLYTQVTVNYANSDSDKMPAGDSSVALEEFSTRLRSLLNDNGALLAQQTGGGQRQFHFYIDPESGVLPELEMAVREWKEGRTRLETLLDPHWETIEPIIKPIRRRLGQ
ncbi:DUF695 domain-containing protein [Salinactinospora qingdaonensis]|uniref:DUF695 domain-containing protein n=1 Tax=Salinactinospora qingdaonensis TaxID=702744 RepID=A0ABP7GJE1_9ACTN